MRTDKFNQKDLESGSNSKMWATIRWAFDIEFMPMPYPFQRNDDVDNLANLPLEDTTEKY